MHLKELRESREVDITFIVNDTGDVLVRLKPVAVDKGDEEFADIIDQDQEEGDIESMLKCSFFFFIPADGDANREFIYFDSKTDAVTSMVGG